MINVALHRLHPVPCCCVFIFVFASSSLLMFAVHNEIMKSLAQWKTCPGTTESAGYLPLVRRWRHDSAPSRNLSTTYSKTLKGSKRFQKDPKGIKAKHSCHTRWLRAICKTYIDLSIQILGFFVKGQQNPVQPRSRSLELISVLPSLAVLVELVDRCTWGPYSCRMCRSIKYIWLSHSDIKRHSS